MIQTKIPCMRVGAMDMPKYVFLKVETEKKVKKRRNDKQLCITLFNPVKKQEKQLVAFSSINQSCFIYYELGGC